jgi:hypothetical protein
VRATLALQIIYPGFKKQLNSAGNRPEDVNTAVMAGLRIHARF